MKNTVSTCSNEKGIAVVIVISILAIITLVGVMITRKTSTELQIATSDHIYKVTFYAAEAARAYVLTNTDLYGSGNIETGNPIGFPDNANSSVTQELSTDSLQFFNGQVDYLTPSNPPRGSGFEVGKFKAHVYQMTCTGYGPRESETQIEAGFYRIGF
jgi:hypothetical protein